MGLSRGQCCLQILSYQPRVARRVHGCQGSTDAEGSEEGANAHGGPSCKKPRVQYLEAVNVASAVAHAIRRPNHDVNAEMQGNANASSRKDVGATKVPATPARGPKTRWLMRGTTN